VKDDDTYQLRHFVEYSEYSMMQPAENKFGGEPGSWLLCSELSGRNLTLDLGNALARSASGLSGSPRSIGKA
jgi:hypothetical protein